MKANFLAEGFVAKRTFNDLFRHFLDEQPAPNSELYCDSAVVRAKPFNLLHAFELAKGRQNHSTIIIDQTKVTSYNGGVVFIQDLSKAVFMHHHLDVLQ